MLQHKHKARSTIPRVPKCIHPTPPTHTHTHTHRDTQTHGGSKVWLIPSNCRVRSLGPMPPQIWQDRQNRTFARPACTFLQKPHSWEYGAPLQQSLARCMSFGTLTSLRTPHHNAHQKTKDSHRYREVPLFGLALRFFSGCFGIAAS